MKSNKVTAFFKKRPASEEQLNKSKDVMSQIKNRHISQKTTMLATINMWQLIALVSLFAVVASLAGWYNLASQPKYIPYVIQMDKFNYVYPAMPAVQTVQSDPRVSQHFISTFINSTRTVTPDMQLQRKMIFDSYALVDRSSPAFYKLNMHFNPEDGKSPFAKSQEFLANVEIESIIPLVGNSWQVDWREKILQRNGDILADYKMRSTITLKAATPDSNLTEEEIRSNPLGVYVEDYSWQKLN